MIIAYDSTKKNVLSCPDRFHDMLVRSVALLTIDAIGFKLYVRQFVGAFRFVVLYCIVVCFFPFLLFLSLGDEIKLLNVVKMLLSCPFGVSYNAWKFGV